MPTANEAREIRAARLVSMMIEEQEFCETMRRGFPVAELFPTLPDDRRERIEELIRESAASILNEVAISMARYLPAEDVEAFIALFDSELGRRWLDGARKMQADLAAKVGGRQHALRREIDRILSGPAEC